MILLFNQRGELSYSILMYLTKNIVNNHSGSRLRSIVRTLLGDYLFCHYVLLFLSFLLVTLFYCHFDLSVGNIPMGYMLFSLLRYFILLFFTIKISLRRPSKFICAPFVYNTRYGVLFVFLHKVHPMSRFTLSCLYRKSSILYPFIEGL